MKKFRHLHVPDHWEQYWSRYPQGYTILEALINWASQVDDMVDNQNVLNITVEDFRKELDDFVEAFDPNLQEKVVDTLYEWQQSGFLDVVIDQALQTQIDDVSVQLEENEKFVGVRSFGGGSADHTQMLQNLIDSLEENQTLLFRGNYNITSLKLKSNIHLKSVGGKLIGTSSAYDMIELNNAKNVVIEGFDVEVTHGGITNEKGQFVGGRGENITIKDNNVVGTGILISGIKNINIKGNTLKGNGKITNNGILVRNCVNYVIDDNDVDGFNHDGIKVSNLDQQETTITPFSVIGRITNNRSNNNLDDGIDIYAGGRELIISNNHCYNNKYGLNIKSHGTNTYAENYAEKSIVSGNILKKNSGGIVIYGDDYIITGNVVSESINHGIIIGSLDSANTITIKNILVSSNIISNSGMNGIVVSQYTVDISLNGNVITKTLGNGVNISSNFISIVGGSIIDCVGTGINYNPNNPTNNFIYINGLRVSNRDTSNTITGINLSVNTHKATIVGCDVEGVETKFKDNSNKAKQLGNNWNIDSGTTQERPTVAGGAQPLQTYFDTTLNKPIWRNPSNSGWVDSTGAPV